jgi:hypothetical protein
MHRSLRAAFILAFGLGLIVASSNAGMAQNFPVWTKDCCSACKFYDIIKVQGRSEKVWLPKPLCYGLRRVSWYASCPAGRFTCY